jgi:hypothetical protein
MAQESPLPTPPSQAIHAHLQAISELLRQPNQLDASAQAALANLVDELDNILKQDNIPNEDAVQLAATAAHFAEAVRRGEKPGVLKAARDQLEKAAIATETKAPLIAGLATRIVEVLADFGI